MSSDWYCEFEYEKFSMNNIKKVETLIFTINVGMCQRAINYDQYINCSIYSSVTERAPEMTFALHSCALRANRTCYHLSSRPIDNARETSRKHLESAIKI